MGQYWKQPAFQKGATRNCLLLRLSGCGEDHGGLKNKLVLSLWRSLMDALMIHQNIGDNLSPPCFYSMFVLLPAIGNNVVYLLADGAEVERRGYLIGESCDQ